MHTFSLNILFIGSLLKLSAGKTFKLTDFGAKGDNSTLNTKAFEMAVAAVDKAGGGTLLVPDGVFVTAPFNLTSHMVLYLSGNAEIRGPTKEQLGKAPDFPLWPVIPAMPSYGQGRDHTGVGAWSVHKGVGVGLDKAR